MIGCWYLEIMHKVRKFTGLDLKKRSTGEDTWFTSTTLISKYIENPLPSRWSHQPSSKLLLPRSTGLVFEKICFPVMLEIFWCPQKYRPWLEIYLWMSFLVVWIAGTRCLWKSIQLVLKKKYEFALISINLFESTCLLFLNYSRLQFLITM